MKITANRYVCIISFVFFFSVSPIGSKDLRTNPTLNNGKKWRIGYLEGGPYVNYRGSLECTIRALMALDWIEKADIPRFSDIEDNRMLWDWLAGKTQSRYLAFPENAYWSSAWIKKNRPRNVAQIKKRMNETGDIDLFVAMGTWAGQDLVPILKNTPIIVMSCSDPIKSKIVKSAKDSGKDNVHAWCDPTRSERRLRLFQDILGFGKLGVIYEDSESGRVFANLESIRKVSKERKFDIVGCKAADEGMSLHECKEAVSTCIDEIKSEIDALAISDHRGFHPNHMPDIIDPLLKKGIPIFTTVSGPLLVRRGVLMGIAREDYQPLGKFYAKTIAGIFNGSKPRDLTQIYKEPLKLAINLETAKTIGYDIPPNVKKIADILYEKIDRTPLD